MMPKTREKKKDIIVILQKFSITLHTEVFKEYNKESQDNESPVEESVLQRSFLVWGLDNQGIEHQL